MQYGFFDDTNREYVIQTPETPSPWINYLGNEKFFSLVSQTGGGYCFYRDARLRRVLRYRYNNIPIDSNGRYFFIHEDNDYWSVGYMPVRREVDSFECRHGLGYTKITSSRKQLKSSVLMLVPNGHHAEVHLVTLKNESDRPRKLKLFSYVEFCLWDAQADMANLQRNLNVGEVEVHGSTIYHTTEYRERRNHYAFYHANAALTGFDTQREDFLGAYNGLHEPQAVASGHARNSLASGWSPIASHCLEIDLGPGEERELVFTLGYVENEEHEKWNDQHDLNRDQAQATIESFSSSAQVYAALDSLKGYWEDLLHRFVVESDDPRLNRMVNTWNPYQCMVTFNLSRSASYYETGIGRGMGFRDCNQDLLSVVHMVPDRARERLLDLAATQFADGSAFHQYQPLTKRGNHEIGNGFNDDPLWLILATCAYVKETGDAKILEENVPFDHDPKHADATLLDHLQASFRFTTERLGPHGLPLIGRADWNDCLNLNCFSTNPDESFQTTENRVGGCAESIFIAGLFIYASREYANLLEQVLDDSDQANTVRQAINAMEDAVIQHGYDGQWFLRAYDAEGNKIGSQENQEGQIFIEPQGFCAMAEIGRDQGLCHQALDSVKARLDSDHGIVLQSPSYSQYHLELGEISSYPPGYKENGGVFCHNNPWVMIAEATLGRGEQAFEYYKKIAPAYLEHQSKLRRTEPYVYAQMVAGPDAPHHGQAKNSWLTGTAAWNYVAITQHLLGIRAEHHGLRIRPQLLSAIGNYTVLRRCREASYEIRSEHCATKADARLVVDGKLIEGDLIPYAQPGKQVVVECYVYQGDAHRVDQPHASILETQASSRVRVD